MAQTAAILFMTMLRSATGFRGCAQWVVREVKRMAVLAGPGHGSRGGECPGA